MSPGDVVQHIYVPLLTQETAVMISTLTYGIKAGVSVPVLVVVNTAAVFTDLAAFFVPSHFLSNRLHRLLIGRFRKRYEQGRGYADRFGAFRTATVMGFVMPSVAAMIVVGLLRLSFWRAFAGLLVGSAFYVAIPLLVALPVASVLPSFLLPWLQWVPLAVALLVIVVAVVRSRLSGPGEPPPAGGGSEAH